MLRLLRYFSGYLLIKINGDGSETFLNRCISKGINIWNLHYKNGLIYGYVAVKNFKKMFMLRHKINCKIKIVKKCGLYFRVKNYKKRIGIFVGVAVFISILSFLCNFVWVINIEGNNNITTDEIIDICDMIGIREGIRKSDINSKYDPQRLMLAQNKIAWCSFNIEGCLLTINISEIITSDKSDRKTPTNIKATTAGKIKKIDAISGDVLVKIGDIVSENDLLVSGVIQNDAGSHFVYSEAKIIAETTRTFSAQGEFVQKHLTPTGNTKQHIIVDFFNIKIPLYLENPKGEFENIKSSNHLKLFNKKIPIKIFCQKYNILQKENVSYTSAQLEEKLYLDIQKQVDNFDFINFKEKARESVFTDKGLLLKITYTCEENIALQDTILLSKEN